MMFKATIVALTFGACVSAVAWALVWMWPAPMLPDGPRTQPEAPGAWKQDRFNTVPPCAP